MLKKLVLAATLASAFPAFAASPVEGVWWVQDRSAKVRIAPCGQKLCGTIVWISDRIDKATGLPPVDSKNPDPSLRSRPIVGLQLIRNFSPAGEGKWSGGTIYDPEAGKTYVSKMTLTPKGTLKVEGCVSVICQAQTWSSADVERAAISGNQLSRQACSKPLNQSAVLPFRRCCPKGTRSSRPTPQTCGSPR